MRAGTDRLRQPGKRLGADPQLIAELALAEAFQSSHSHLLGGPNRWTAYDRVKAVWFRAWKAEHVCPDCHSDPTLWTVSDDGVPTIPYLARLGECGACGALELLKKQVESDPGMQGMNGVKYRLEPFTPPQRELAGVG